MSALFSTPGYSLIEAWWWPYLFVALVGFLPTEVWRQLGVTLAGDMSESSPVLVWVRSVATALVAAVIAKLILYPSGALAATPTGLRLGAAAMGFAAFKVAGANVGVGVITAEAVLIGGWILLG